MTPEKSLEQMALDEAAKQENYSEYQQEIAEAIIRVAKAYAAQEVRKEREFCLREINLLKRTYVYADDSVSCDDVLESIDSTHEAIRARGKEQGE